MSEIAAVMRPSNVDAGLRLQRHIHVREQVLPDGIWNRGRGWIRYPAAYMGTAVGKRSRRDTRIRIGRDGQRKAAD